MILPKANTGHMTDFVIMVSARFPTARILLVMEGAGWHRAKALAMPTYMRHIFLSPYSPETNQVKHT